MAEERVRTNTKAVYEAFIEHQINSVFLASQKVIEARAVHQNAAFEAAMMFARTEGRLCAPETAHAIRAAIDEALKCKESGESKTILIAHSGHGHFDLAAYDEYLSGRMCDYELPEDVLKKSLASLPKVPGR